ncbi:MAG: type II toxin-antitoxin system RelB/DinJ family antitoxin [Magnetococcus sp. YQC-5]
MTDHAIVSARIDTATKEQATLVLSAMGLNLSDAIRLLMLRIVDEQRLPFDIHVPNALTRSTLRKSELGEEVHYAKDADDLFWQLGV